MTHQSSEFFRKYFKLTDPVPVEEKAPSIESLKDNPMNIFLDWPQVSLDFNMFPQLPRFEKPKTVPQYHISKAERV